MAISFLNNRAKRKQFMQWTVQAWRIPGDEEGTQEGLEVEQTFDFSEEAMQWAWDRMEEGFQTRLYRQIASK